MLLKMSFDKKERETILIEFCYGLIKIQREAYLMAIKEQKKSKLEWYAVDVFKERKNIDKQVEKFMKDYTDGYLIRTKNYIESIDKNRANSDHNANLEVLKKIPFDINHLADEVIHNIEIWPKIKKDELNFHINHQCHCEDTSKEDDKLKIWNEINLPCELECKHRHEEESGEFNFK